MLFTPPAHPRIGFIGQGYVGRNYADDFEQRGYPVVRYALEEPYRDTKEVIRDCDVVFIAVPTPTTLEGFDDSLVREALALVGVGKIAIVKSTILPGSTKSFQEQYPDRIIFYSPEFLSEVTAAHDAAHPFSNILGSAITDEVHQSAAEWIHTHLASAAFSQTCTSTEAELIKYAHNGNGFFAIVFFNMIYDLTRQMGADWAVVEKALQADPYIAKQYTNPVHKSGRGAGGHCFIKDFAALRDLYAEQVGDVAGTTVLMAMEQKNKTLLTESGKDLDLLKGIYGDNV